MPTHTNIQIENYSPRSFAVIGDTKSHREALKRLGGNYNPYLRFGPGWIFSVKRRALVEEYIEHGTLPKRTDIDPETGNYRHAKSPRKTNDEAFRAIYDRAVEAGLAAGESVVPTPMHIVGGGQHWEIPEGPCGFAWVNVKPGTSRFARWLKSEGLAQTDSYYGGVTIWISDYDQSHTQKSAHAKAMADSLSESGIKAYNGSRLD